MSKLTIITTWTHRWFGGSAYTGGHERDGQVTEVEVDGVHAWVRESIRRPKRSRLEVSSAARLGRYDGSSRRGCRDVLELCAPAEQWDAIAMAVHEADVAEGWGREVVKARDWTPAGVEASRRADERWRETPLAWVS